MAKWPGSFIFRSSAFGRQLEANPHNTDDVILPGDSGYALRPYLITPYLQPALPYQRRLNRAQKNTMFSETCDWYLEKTVSCSSFRNKVG